jgi:hypothetical protein
MCREVAKTRRLHKREKEHHAHANTANRARSSHLQVGIVDVDLFNSVYTSISVIILW